MALNILFAIMNVGVWLLVMMGLPIGGRDISIFLDFPSREPMHMLNAIMLWLLVKYFGRTEPAHINKKPHP